MANGMAKLHIHPLCLEVIPSDLVELRSCIENVLMALVKLHEDDFVHRDIRWPNVLKGPSSWLLADFELSNKASVRSLRSNRSIFHQKFHCPMAADIQRWAIFIALASCSLIGCQCDFGASLYPPTLRLGLIGSPLLIQELDQQLLCFSPSEEPGSKMSEGFDTGWIKFLIRTVGKA